MTSKSENFEALSEYPELSKYEAVIYDGYCSEPIAWGYKLRRTITKEKFESLRAFGTMECLGLGVWVLVVKRLTPEDAIERYGQIASQEFGPQRGWKSVVYGDKKFINRKMQPDKKFYKNNKNYIEIILEKKKVLNMDDLINMLQY